MRHRGSGDHAYAQDVRTGRRQSGDDRRLQELPGRTGVAPDHHGRTAGAGRTVLSEHRHGRRRQPQR